MALEVLERLRRIFLIGVVAPGLRRRVISSASNPRVRQNRGLSHSLLRFEGAVCQTPSTL
jgi:hypothetical protein